MIDHKKMIFLLFNRTNSILIGYAIDVKLDTIEKWISFSLMDDTWETIHSYNLYTRYYHVSTCNRNDHGKDDHRSFFVRRNWSTTLFLSTNQIAIHFCSFIVTIKKSKTFALDQREKRMRQNRSSNVARSSARYFLPLTKVVALSSLLLNLDCKTISQERLDVFSTSLLLIDETKSKYVNEKKSFIRKGE